MCGIAGILNLNSSEVVIDQLKRMTNAIAHRGPDGEGHWISTNKKVGFGHRRLSIIDLSENGRQPMHYAEGRYTITFNGEIYNYIELKESLLSKGYQFRSDSDTEVLMALYDAKREACLQDLDGMFAFAIWDEVEKSLFCARDRFGEKPFYYAYKKDQTLTFASEMKALFASGISRTMDSEMVFNYLSDPYIISDFNDKSRTFYQEISKLEQSHYLLIKANGDLVKKQYWTIDADFIDESISFETACEQFKALFYQSISRRLRSDVPVGSSLSGGLDSSSIVCGISELNKGNIISQNSFSARFSNFDRDEGYYIEKVIEKTGVTANYVWPTEEGFLNDFEKLCFHQEEPFPSASIYAQFEVMRLAKEKNVTVLLDGQGADECLAGYEYYFDTFLKELKHKKDASYQLQFQKLSEKYAQFLSNETKFGSSSVPKVSMVDQLKNIVRPVYQLVNPVKYKNIETRTASQIKKETLFHKDYLQQFKQGKIVSQLPSSFDTLNQHLKYSLFVNNLEDLLRFSDRNSMAYSREVRLPFLSHELVAFIFSLPANYKVNDGWSKYVLRQSMNSTLPQEIAWRKDKIGYEPPQKKWMQHASITERIETMKEKLISEKIINSGVDLDENQKFSLLNLLYFQ
jgi:asparagine synthase (glutamine-hydrolysing)